MLASLIQVKTHLGIALANTAEDALLSQLLGQVDRLVKDDLGNPIEADTYVEYRDGTNTPVLKLRYRPVRSITEVRLDARGFGGAAPGGFGTSTILTAGVDYWLKPDQPDGSSRAGLLCRINGVWPGSVESGGGLLGAAVVQGQGNVRISYHAGWLNVPEDLTLAVCEIIAYVRRTLRFGGGLPASESLGDYSVSYFWALYNQAKAYGSVNQILASYKGLQW